MIADCRLVELSRRWALIRRKAVGDPQIENQNSKFKNL
jgi:hypothetical protein